MGPMVEIEREKVPRRRASRRRPDLRRRRPAASARVAYPLYFCLPGKGRAVRAPAGASSALRRNGFPGYYARLPSKYLPLPSARCERARLARPTIVIAVSSAGGKSPRCIPEGTPLFFPHQASFSWPHAIVGELPPARAIRRSEINGSVYPAH